MGFGLGKPLQYGFQLESVGITTDFPFYSLFSASKFSFFFFLKVLYVRKIIGVLCGDSVQVLEVSAFMDYIKFFSSQGIFAITVGYRFLI